jgi:hypothetical protein
LLCKINDWFPVLHRANPAQRGEYEIEGGGASLHRPEPEEGLSVGSLLAGADRRST